MRNVLAEHVLSVVAAGRLRRRRLEDVLLALLLERVFASAGSALDRHVRQNSIPMKKSATDSALVVVFFVVDRGDAGRPLRLGVARTRDGGPAARRLLRWSHTAAVRSGAGAAAGSPSPTVFFFRRWRARICASCLWSTGAARARAPRALAASRSKPNAGFACITSGSASSEERGQLAVFDVRRVLQLILEEEVDQERQDQDQ